MHNRFSQIFSVIMNQMIKFMIRLQTRLIWFGLEDYQRITTFNFWILTNDLHIKNNLGFHMYHFYRVFASFPIHCNRMEKSSQHSPQNFSFYVSQMK